jgi:hypothetical protein
MTDLTGKLVRWDNKGQWFTARVTGGDGGSGRGSWTGEVVDPGNYIGLSEFAPKQALHVGQELPNLRPELLAVLDEPACGSQVGDQ